MILNDVHLSPEKGPKLIISISIKRMVIETMINIPDHHPTDKIGHGRHALN